MTDYELGRKHGYFGSLVQYPNNVNYMTGYHAGYAKGYAEYLSEKPFADALPLGVSDANFDQHYI
jgi:hypothetical protein